MSDIEIKNRIIDQARAHFLKFGFSKVTMNEIAEDLGMSKKTVYSYFPSKEELLLATIEKLQKETTCQIDELAANTTLEFGEKLKKIMAVIAAHHSHFDAHFVSDLQRHVPDMWRCCDDFRRDRIRSLVAKLLREGKEKHYVRFDVDEQFLTAFYLAIVQFVFSPDMVSQIPLSTGQVFESAMKILFEGLLTDEARSKFVSVDVAAAPAVSRPG